MLKFMLYTFVAVTLLYFIILTCGFLRFYFWDLFLYILHSLLSFGVILFFLSCSDGLLCVCAFYSMEFLENEAESCNLEFHNFY